MNAHLERFKKTTQEEFIDYHVFFSWILMSSTKSLLIVLFFTIRKGFTMLSKTNFLQYNLWWRYNQNHYQLIYLRSLK